MIAYLDCFSGVSGDKFLAALLDAGFDPDLLKERLESTGLAGWSLEIDRVRRAGFDSLSVRVVVDRDQPSRDWRDIQVLLQRSSLPRAVKERSLEAFGALAAAEARAHGMPVDDVHFHEVGAVDSIVDVVGVVSGLDALGIEELHCSPLALGSGTVTSEHGVLPVPAPATALLVEDVPTYGGPVEAELTTPTGAALVRTVAARFGHMPPMTVRSLGLGAGARDLELPNVLRLFVGEPADASSETVVALRSVIDHRSPEELAHALDRLRSEGALDAWQTPVVMKKGRAGFEVTVLAAPPDATRLAEVLMRETGTLGVRHGFVDRTVAPRSVVTIDTSMGPVRFKVATMAGTRHLRPEHDDVARLATEHGLSVHETAERLLAEARDALD
jgi:uncharacterized protein (TIGR00299 family) protein